MKTKLFTFILALTASVGTIWASNTQVGGIWYDFDSKNLKATVTYRGSNATSYSNEYQGNVDIPSTVTYSTKKYTVTTINESTFYNCTGLKSVTIPNTVTSIGYDAFAGCTGLTTVNITDIAAWCNINFEDAGANPLNQAHQLYINGTQVTDLIIPNTVTSIGDNAFNGCTSLTSVTIPDNVTNIGAYAFKGCSSLKSVKVGNGITKIGDHAFSGCSNITSVTLNSNAIVSYQYSNNYCIKGIFGEQVTSYIIGNDVTSIGDYAFYGCTALKSVTIGNSVTSIGICAFRDCTGLTSINLPSSITNIGTSAFLSCQSLTSLTIPNNVTSIGERAFRGCSGLTYLSIPDNVTNIGSYTFTSCSGLTSVTIGNSITSIGEYAFSGCTSLTSISIPNSVESIGDFAFEDCSSAASLTIGNSVTSIGQYAFKNCIGITSLTIGNSVNSIGYNAFSGCTGLTTVNLNSGAIVSKQYRITDFNMKTFFGNQVTSYIIGNGITSIGNYAFYGCTGMKSVTIPNSMTSIGICAFRDCTGLTSITIPKNVTSIGSYAFDNSSNIISVVWNAKNCNSYNFGSQVTSFTFGNEVEVVPGSICSGMNKLISISLPNSVTSIGEQAFYGCTGLTAISISNIVTNIGEQAFKNCTGLKSVTINSDAIVSKQYSSDSNLKNIFGDQVKTYIIGDDVTSIGDYVFYDCSGLTSMTIGNNVTTIGNSAFKSCTGLTSVTIPNSVTSIGESAFYHCTGLTSVEIPNSVTSIGSYTFTGCTGLTSVTIGNSITSIGEHAFENCTGLTSIEIPNSVTSIGFNAFKGCSNLSIVTCHAATPPSCDSKAFENCSSKTLYVMETSISAYQVANIWKTFGTILAIKTAIGDLYYNLNEQSRTATVTSSLEGKYSGNIVIPSTVTFDNVTYSVTSIGSNAFRNCTGLTSVEIPNSVTSIGESAFNGCTGLTSVTIPNSVTSIGQNAFKDCNNLSIYVSCGDLDRIKYMLNNDSRVKYKPIPYSITTNATNGTVSSSQKDCDELELSAIPNEGYHFVQWSDGNTSNPRTIHVTQDMTFTAVFAMNTYTVTTQSNNPEWGTTRGGKSVPYLDKVEISATANYGYHFVEWMVDISYLQIDDAISVSQAYNIAAGLANGATTSSKYTIVGYVTSEYRTYTNSYYLSDSPDEPGNFVVFRCASSANIGDRVMVKGYLTNYQGTTPETTQGSSLSVLQKYKDNPWSFAVKNDMTIIARFAKNTYTVSGQYDKKMGSIEGLGKYEYLDAVKLSPIPNYGYHFAQWSDGNTDNPRTIILTQDTMISAIFKPNPKITYSCNSEYGHIIGDTITPTGVAVDTITFEAISNYGYHFTQWSDGNKENPRSIILTQDTVMAAEFAIDKSGTCGKDNALTWSYEDQSKTLTITGNGELTENYTFGLEAPTQMVTLIIGNGVTAIGDSAFYATSTLNHLFIGSSVASIGNYTFSECRNFDDITCYATIVPTINATTFANVGNKQYIPLYVPENRENAYHRDEFWGEFGIQVKSAETTTTNGEVTIVPTDNTAEISWPTVKNANTYEIVITKDGEVFCVLTFNANGQLAGIAFAPGRNEANHTQQSQKTGFKFTVTGLNSGTQYGYSIDSKNQGGSTIDSKTGTFTTTMEGESITSEGFEDVLSTEKVHKILRDGQIYILRGEKVYTLQGQEIK